MKVAVTEFEEQSRPAGTGEATQGSAGRLRDIGGLKPWGAIVYDKDAGKWGMSWEEPSRKNAVEQRATNAAPQNVVIEISFFGTSCGAFALSSAGFSIVSRDDIQKAKQAALDDCGKRGKAAGSLALPVPMAGRSTN